MKLQDLTLEGIDLKRGISNNFLNFSQEDINKIIDIVNYRIAEEKNSNSKSGKNQEITSPLLTIYEAEKYLKIKKTTLDKLRKSGELKFRKIGGGIFFTYEDLNNYISRCSSTNIVMCFKSNIFIEPTSQEILLNKNGKIYYIYKENKIWIYLLSDRLIKLSRKQFNKYFRNAEDFEVAAYKYML
jgi:excisionase family DNA binding protein